MSRARLRGMGTYLGWPVHRVFNGGCDVCGALSQIACLLLIGQFSRREQSLERLCDVGEKFGVDLGTRLDELLALDIVLQVSDPAAAQA